MAADNKVPGQFDLVGIPPARGMPQSRSLRHRRQRHRPGVAKDKATGGSADPHQASGGPATPISM
jgi:hypothetical protein